MKRTLKIATAVCALIAVTGMFDSVSSHSRANAEEKYQRLPDLIIKHLVPSSPQENVMWVYVYNQGAAYAGKSTLAVLWSNGRASTTFYVPIDGLPAHTGEKIGVTSTTVKMFAHNSKSRYIVDYYNVVAESDETNNEVDVSY